MKIVEIDYNIQTGKETVIERDETAAEVLERETLETKIALVKAEAEAKATARQAILDRLGLTADEAALLIG
jgi:hypothetical protein